MKFFEIMGILGCVVMGGVCGPFNKNADQNDFIMWGVSGVIVAWYIASL